MDVTPTPRSSLPIPKRLHTLTVARELFQGFIQNSAVVVVDYHQGTLLLFPSLATNKLLTNQAGRVFRTEGINAPKGLEKTTVLYYTLLRCSISTKLHYTDSSYGHVVQHHQRTSSQQFCNLLYNKFITNGQKFATSQHLDMSRCWALSSRCGKFVVELL